MYRIKYIFFIFCALLGLLSARAAAPEEIHGKIISGETGEPLSGVVVRCLNAEGKAVSFSSSDRTGTFLLKITSAVDSISFRCMGYEERVFPINYDFTREVVLQAKVTRLKDVVVEAPDIYARGDTLVFNVSRYANAKDNAIIDVIKRLPGIKVEEDGTIKYQGKPINKFYIDGNDFIGGQYNLATDNISHKDVKSVEVMENHQPVKALEGIEFPEEAGINLKLKEDARSRWVGVAKGGIGLEPILYDGSLYAMRIAPKMQNIVTIRGGNTSWNPQSQITEHGFKEMFSSDYSETLWPGYITADMVAAPLSEKRTRDNLSWIGSSISAWKKGDTSMRMKLNYNSDRLDYTSGVVTDYLSQSIPDFVQKSYLRTQSYNLSAQFNAEVNKRGYFLKEKLNVGTVWNKGDSEITGSFDVAQNVRRRKFSVVNDLKLVKRNYKKLFQLISRNSFLHSPDRLSVYGSEEALQNINVTDVRSSTETKFGRFSRFWKLYTDLGLDLNYHRMNTRLTGMREFDNTGITDAFLSNLYATPQFDYDRNSWRISLKVPVKWLHHSVNGRYDYINLMPRFTVYRKISSKSELSGSITYRLGSPGAYMNIDLPILCDYRNLFISGIFRDYTHDLSSVLTYRYRNPLSSLFMNMSVTYNYTHSAMMSHQIFIDDFIISTYTDKISGKNSWFFNGGISKGLGHSKMVIGCDVNSSLTSASSMRDYAIIPYRHLTSGVKPYFKGSVLRWLSLNYDAEYSYSKLKLRGESSDSHSFVENLYATVSPDDRVHLTFGAQHFLTHFPEGNTDNLLLLDAFVIWVASRQVRISLTADNLLDKRIYSYVSYGTMTRSEHTFCIRPRNLLFSVQYRFR